MMSIEFPVQRLAAGLKRRGCTMAAVVGFGVVLSGCAVGPDFVAPAAPPANSYGAPTMATDRAQAGAVPATPTVSQRLEPGVDVPGLWWELFHSEALNRLVESALANNNDVKSAQAALSIAAENAAAQNGAFYPQVSVSMASTRQSTAGTLSSPLASNSYVFNLHTPQLNISYAPDVFGGNRRLVESLEAQVETQRYLVEATRLTLTSNVVMAVIQEASLRDQIKATQDIAGLQRQQLGLLHKQLKAGASTVAEVALQEAVMAQTDASLPVLQKQLSLQRNQLTALLGRLPSDAPTDTFELAMLELPDQFARIWGPTSPEGHSVEPFWPDAILAVKEVRPDLNEDQCWQVLQHAQRHHDATVGISWEVLDIVAGILFGDAAKEPDQ